MPTTASPGEDLSLVDGLPIVKRPYVLADGRELVYYDDADTTLAPERLPDERLLDPRPATAVMRQDVLTGEWISIAAARNNRVFLPPANLDPLAPQAPDNPSEVPSLYDVAVFENRSPSFGPDLLGPGETPVPLERGIALGRSRPSIGRCEVVCFSPEREGSFGSLGTSRARTVIEAWADRTAVLSALPGVEQVFPFENRGEQVGVTLHHPHGQIYSYPFVSPRTQRLIASIDSYGPDLFADILAHEQAGDRMIVQGEHWSAFVPFAARWPVEVHILPHRQLPDLAATTPEERDELAVLYPRVLRAIDGLYPTPTPYIAGWHQAPVNAHRDDIRLMLQITSPRRAVDRLKFLAGSESAMGAFIGDVPPELTAQNLRESYQSHE
ncbi:galactose-1-phosphate uridylyltransferase [Subtercola boreus]|uniref:Galactose-1-phosphate uridylyltransferase n=1 Tax=Subtercola boreus TaxID=120213 RepID=A0A3E0W7W4_9MICO|nr:galactose-1-phosphate uridylyltransferase [Subtercola boreus]RFA17917.1 galactose-1-phosphate uridylyltransferase [Subtercola boreus]RFA18299.1 galactose-1-phosphate uridylyltransferase [Subtercola boreus]RFA24829.1 galactose-1-phosphate uridylyltransferase [Subtercola boreus]